MSKLCEHVLYLHVIHRRHNISSVTAHVYYLAGDWPTFVSAPSKSHDTSGFQEDLHSKLDAGMTMEHGIPSTDWSGGHMGLGHPNNHRDRQVFGLAWIIILLGTRWAEGSIIFLPDISTGIWFQEGCVAACIHTHIPPHARLHCMHYPHA